MSIRITIEQKTELKPQLKQKIRLTPQLEAEMKILMMPIEELEEKIITEAQENPFIEVEWEDREEEIKIEEEKEIEDKNELMREGEEQNILQQNILQDEQNMLQREEDEQDELQMEIFENFEELSNPHIKNPEIREYIRDIEANIPSDESIDDKIISQIEAKFEDKRKTIALAILNEIDEKGYIAVPIEQIIEKLRGFGIETNYLEVEEVRRTIMNDIEPPGLASKDPYEFLMLMLKKKEIASSLAQEITKEKILELMTKYGRLVDEVYMLGDKKQKKEFLSALQAKVDYEEPNIRKIRELIESDIPPYPTFEFKSPEYSLEKIKADVEVFEDKGKIYVLVNAPKINFINLLSEDGEEKEIFQLSWYIKSRKGIQGEKKKKIDDLVWRAKVLYEGVKMRRDMLEKACKVIFSKQIEFLKTGDEKTIKPLTLKNISDECSISEGSISKTIKGKYVKTPHGIFPIKKFLSVGVGENKKISQKHILQEMAEIIRNEDRQNPISDSEIAKILERKLGVKIARRTVVKYRQKLGIKNVEERKKLYAELLLKK